MDLFCLGTGDVRANLNISWKRTKWNQLTPRRGCLSRLWAGLLCVKAHGCLDIVNFILSNLISVSKYILRIIRKLTLWFTMTIIKLFNPIFWIILFTTSVLIYTSVSTAIPALFFSCRVRRFRTLNPQNSLGIKVTLLTADCKVLALRDEWGWRRNHRVPNCGHSGHLESGCSQGPFVILTSGRTASTHPPMQYVPDFSHWLVAVRVSTPSPAHLFKFNPCVQNSFISIL